MDAAILAVIGYWFGDQHAASFDNKALWFSGGPAADAEIRQRFGTLIEQAAAAQLRHWDEQALSRLAHILVLDQFSRNAFRGTAQAFAQDALCRRVVLDGFDLGHDDALPTAGRTFFYMPLMHAEDLALHDLCVARFEALLASAAPEHAGTVRSNLDYAHKHRAIIHRFGRYPHRNAVLGRPSSAEELAFLTDPSTRFGQ